MGDDTSLPDLMIGSRGEYHWLTSLGHGITDLLPFCPELVIGKYIAVTACDSGPLRLSAEKRQLGWESRDGIAYSPTITSLDLLPQRIHYDEWYVFQAAKDFGRLKDRERGTGAVVPFVNYGDFIFDPGNESVADQFWQQLEWIRAESYIAESDLGWLTFVSRNVELFAAVAKQLQPAS